MVAIELLSDDYWLFHFCENFESGGVKVGNSVKSGNGVAFSICLCYNYKDEK